jgi:dipeptidyl aminopeptidase/acylaminoacyl peptidase
MKADGSNSPGTRLTTNPASYEGDTNPEISPDGETVTFVRRKVEGELQALFAVNIDGTDVRKLVPYGFNVFIKHDWAPDGKHIVFTSPIEGQANVYTVAPDGSHRVQLTHVLPDRGAPRQLRLRRAPRPPQNPLLLRCSIDPGLVAGTRWVPQCSISTRKASSPSSSCIVITELHRALNACFRSG